MSFHIGYRYIFVKSSHGSRCEFQASKACEMCDGAYEAGDTMNWEYKLLGSIYISWVDLSIRECNIHIDFNFQEIIIFNRFMLNAQIQMRRANKSQTRRPRFSFAEYCGIILLGNLQNNLTTKLMSAQGARIFLNFTPSKCINFNPRFLLSFYYHFYMIPHSSPPKSIGKKYKRASL